jgi:processive 1,2-diacylglycerol beta-glucosyltransferase
VSAGAVRTLALSVEIGAGHRRAAEALCAGVAAARPGSSQQIIDALELVGPVAGRLARDLYFGVLADAPEIWGDLYEGRGLLELFRPLSELVDDVRSARLAERVRRERPDLILAMHPIACGLAAALGRRREFDIPLVAVLTDFDGHPAWIGRGIDLYLAPTDEVAAELRERGLETGRVAVTGIPLRLPFERLRAEAPDRARLGLARDRFTILLLGGGLGLGPIAEAAQALCRLKGPIQLVVIAGSNRELETSARQLATRAPLPVHVTGQVENIWDYMSAADLAVGKPGGLTCAELLAAGVPMVALAPLPGQERANAAALARAGVLVQADDAEAALRVVEKLLLAPARREEMRQAALRLGRPDSARAAVRAVLELVR